MVTASVKHNLCQYRKYNILYGVPDRLMELPCHYNDGDLKAAGDSEISTWESLICGSKILLNIHQTQARSGVQEFRNF